MDTTDKFLRTLRAAELVYEAGDDGRKPEIPDWRRPEVRDDWRLLEGYEVVES